MHPDNWDSFIFFFQWLTSQDCFEYHEGHLFGFNWNQVERVCKICKKELNQDLLLDLRLIKNEIVEVFNKKQ